MLDDSWLMAHGSSGMADCPWLSCGLSPKKERSLGAGPGPYAPWALTLAPWTMRQEPSNMRCRPWLMSRKPWTTRHVSRIIQREASIQWLRNKWNPMNNKEQPWQITKNIKYCTIMENVWPHLPLDQTKNLSVGSLLFSDHFSRQPRPSKLSS